MKIQIRFTTDPARLMKEEAEAAEWAVTKAMMRVERTGVALWRRDIIRAGLGRRLSYTVRGEQYPELNRSINAAAIIWTKAPKIVGAHEQGSLIRSEDGFWLAIPLPGAPKARFGRKITPGEYEQRTGRRLRMVYRPGRSALLVDTGEVLPRARVMVRSGINKGSSRPARGFRNRSVPIFALVPQVRLPKRLNLDRETDRLAAAIPGMIAQEWD